MSIELFSLKNRTALVTGSSRGLGHAIAEGLAGAGARIVLNGVDPGRLAQSAEEFRRRGHDALEASFDVTSESAVVAAFETLDAEGVEIDILVNNAGIQFRKPLIDLATDDWRKVIDTNLTSAFVVGREAAKRMIARRRGKIINIVSLTSEVARATIAPYTASKGGLKMLTRSMTAEWAEHGIQINGIGPGYMITDMNEALLSNPQFDGWVKSRTPSRRWGKPEELAGAAIFLASSASDYISGQMIYVDGGMLAVL
jgi:gluconate 5-dehydrogenase